MSDDATKDEVRLLNQIDLARTLGLMARTDATQDEVNEVLASYSKSFFTKIVGVTKQNQDGSERQRIIQRCKPGERLRLIREPGNPVNVRAVKVCRASGEQLGYLSDDIVGNEQGIGWCVAKHVDEGCQVEAVIKDITGGGPEKHFGVNIMITFYPYSSFLPEVELVDE